MAGNKKRNQKNRRQNPPPPPSPAHGRAPPPATAEQSSNNVEESSPLDSAPIRIECVRALALIHRQNHAKALRTIKQACDRYRDSALVLRVRGTVLAMSAYLNNNDAAKRRLFSDAAESAERASAMSPSSIEFSQFFASLLYLLANDTIGFEQVIHECERGLSISNPIDPAKDSLNEYNQKMISTAETRIDYMKTQLEMLIRKSKDAIMWGENNQGSIGFHSKEFRAIREEFLVCDQMLSIGMKTTRDEIHQEVIETPPEEQRMAVEDRVTSAKLKRRKKVVLDAKRIDEVRIYWNSLSVGEKRRLLNVRIGDLRGQADSAEEFEKIFSEAINFVEKNRSGKFFECYVCNEKFLDSGELVQHIEKSHLELFLVEWELVTPEEFDEQRVKMLQNGPWQPVDTQAAVSIIESLFHSSSEEEEDEALLKDGQADNELSVFLSNSDGRKWPLSDDSERAAMLNRIHGMLKLLRKHNFLAMSHIEELMKYTVKELKTLVPEWQLLVLKLDRTLFGICFLGASQLEFILECLQELSEACSLTVHMARGHSTDNKVNGNQECEIKEKIVFTGDSTSRGLLDEHLLNGNAVADDGSAMSGLEVSVLLDGDDLIDWLFVSSSLREHLTSWTCLREDKKQKGIQVLQAFEMEHNILRSLFKRKHEQWSHDVALQKIQNILIEESTKRKEVEEYVNQSYRNLLQTRRENLHESGDNATSSSVKVECDVILSVIEEARTMYVDKFGLEALCHVYVHTCDLNCGKVGECTILRTFLQQEEEYIQIAIQSREKHPSKKVLELSEFDARIVQSLANIKQQEIDLRRESANDFQFLMLPLLRLCGPEFDVNSLFQSRLESLVDQDAAEKSAAASLELLAEIEREDKKTIEKGGNQTKHTQNKSKTQKKRNDRRKQKDRKAIGGDKHQVLEEEDLGNEDSLAAYGGENANSEVGSSATEKKLNLHEEELPSKTELGAEERRELEEALESERLIDNETNEEQLDATFETIPQIDIGTGLRNEAGENNRFLDVVIQSLWHVRQFRDELSSLSAGSHSHIADPCIVCSLCCIFNALQIALIDGYRHDVDPSSLGVGLSNIHRCNLFRDGQMKDACEALRVILDCLHQSFATDSGASDTEVEKIGCSGSRVCSSNVCIVHKLFGMDITRKTYCTNCPVKYRQLKFSSLLHNVHARTLIECKPIYGSRLEELLDLAMNETEQSPCDPEEGGCGDLSCSYYYLSTPPPVFTAILGWKAYSESAEDISATLKLLETVIDLSAVYRGASYRSTRHRLMSMICFAGLHYRCFAYKDDLRIWILIDDITVQVIGGWGDVLTKCEQGLLQPQVLFFEG